MTPSPGAVLLDLDGTLLDTAPDLAYALNLLRAEEGLEPLPLADVRGHVSYGAPGLLRAGFGIARTDAGFAEMRTRFLDLYANNLVRESRLFPGFEDVLDELDRRAIRWGIVTNKMDTLTEPLVAAMALSSRAACVISGNSAARAKPWPDPLLLACERMQIDAQRCVYVGDAERDVQAGNSAGMRTLVALFGYRLPDEDPFAWPADGYLDAPGDLLRWL